MAAALHDWAATIGFALVVLGVCVRFRKAIGKALRFYSEIWRRSTALKHLPGPKYGILGVVSEVASRKIHRHAIAWANYYGPVFRVRFLCYHMLKGNDFPPLTLQGVCVTDPQLARAVLRCKELDKFHFQYSQLYPFLIGPNLISRRSDSRWYTIRKGISHAFNSVNLKNVVPVVQERTAVALEILRQTGPDKPFHVEDLMLRLIMDTTGKFGLNKEFHALEGALGNLQGSEEDPGGYCQALIRCTEEVWRRVSSPVAALLHIPRDLDKEGNAIFARWRELVDKMLQHIKTVAPPSGSYAGQLLKIKDSKTGKPLDDMQLMGEMSMLLFGSIDTTSHTLAWTMYFLSQNPKAEAKVVAELDECGLLVTPERPEPRLPGYEDLVRLNYLKNTIKETLRLVPPVGIGQIRVSLRTDLALCNGALRLPRGTFVWVPHTAMHNCEQNWDDPTAFKPERWEDGDAEFAQKPSVLPKEWRVGTNGSDDEERALRYMPFADGIRTCVGQALARTSMPLMLAAQLSRYHFKLAERMGGPEGVQKREQYTLVTGIEGGLWMNAIPRSTTPGYISAAVPETPSHISVGGP